jgi:hypothetical protein
MNVFSPPLSCQGLLGTRRACQTQRSRQQRSLKKRKVKLKRDKGTKSKRILLQAVGDRVEARDHPGWDDELRKSLDVPELVVVDLKLTVDALAKWLKLVEPHDAQGILTRGATLIAEVVTSLPPMVAGGKDAVGCAPKDQELVEKDEKMAAVGAQPSEMKAVRRTIEALSAASKADTDQLGRFAQWRGRNRAEKAKAERALETLGQKLAGLVDESSCDVRAARRKEAEAKQTKETCSAQIVDVVRKRREELVGQGETQASASLQSVLDVWQHDVQAAWASRREGDERVAKAKRALEVAESAQAFYQHLWRLLQEVRARRGAAWARSSQRFEAARIASEARAADALERFIPMLTQALGQFLAFHSILQAKAEAELQEQQQALAEHAKYFGDAAPIKKGDIQRRIHEFAEVTQSSRQAVMYIAKGQQQLWKGTHSILPQSVRLALIREYTALWAQLSGPMQDAMKRSLTAIEKAAGGVVAAEHAPVVRLLAAAA